MKIAIRIPLSLFLICAPDAPGFQAVVPTGIVDFRCTAADGADLGAEGSRLMFAGKFGDPLRDSSPLSGQSSLATVPTRRCGRV